MDTGSRLDQLDRTAVSDRLGSGWISATPTRELPGAPDRRPRPAAVLLPLFRHREAWHLLFIRRTEYTGDDHSGQVAFPGGRRDPADSDAAATALREAQEEIGLDPKQVRLLGKLRPLQTTSNYLVTSFVGEIPWPLDLTPDPVEVARVFHIPLAWLADPTHRQVRTWPAPDHPEARAVIFYDRFDRELLWGVSARITLNFLATLSRT